MKLLYVMCEVCCEPYWITPGLEIEWAETGTLECKKCGFFSVIPPELHKHIYEYNRELDGGDKNQWY